MRHFFLFYGIPKSTLNTEYISSRLDLPSLIFDELDLSFEESLLLLWMDPVLEEEVRFYFDVFWLVLKVPTRSSLLYLFLYTILSSIISSKLSWTPAFDRADVSLYCIFYALASFSPSSLETALSVSKSSLVPTKSIGIFAEACVSTYSIQFLTCSNEALSVRSKTIMTASFLL